MTILDTAHSFTASCKTARKTCFAKIRRARLCERMWSSVSFDMPDLAEERHCSVFNGLVSEFMFSLN